MQDVVIEAVESLPAGSCAPHVVALMYRMDALSKDTQHAMASMFMAAYRNMIETGRTRHGGDASGAADVAY